MDNNDTFVMFDIVFKVGDIVEKWTPEHQWRYWSTIHNCGDVVAVLLLGPTFYRIRRYEPKVKVLWLT